MPGDYGIYVHVPFCTRRCPYCSFTVFVEPDPPFAAWADGVRREWTLRREAFPGEAHSVYFGGGTPSLAPPAAIERVLAALRHHPDAEITLETNPATVTAERLAAYREVGINRLSLGVQTFQPRFARLLARSHTARQARELVELVARAGFRSWSIDLMFALPGQSLDDLHRDLDAILSLAPPHVSLYGLTFHPGTPFARALEAGRLTEVEPDVWREMYDTIVDTLHGAGWERYEVSNFARPGHRAVHNEAVWRGGHYAGLGPGAHGFEPSGARTRNRTTWEDWWSDPLGHREVPTPTQAAIDLVLSTLRHVDGLPLDRLASTGHHLPAGATAALERAGLVARSPDRLRLTSAGFPLADGLVARVVDALVATPDPTEG